MDYKVVITKDAEDDLDRFVKYLIFEKKNIFLFQIESLIH